MKRRISVLTGTRAEFGLLRPLIEKLNSVHEFDVRVVVTGAHLSSEFGMTFNEIEDEGIAIDKKIEILLSGDTPSAVAKSMGVAMISFADYFSELKPDLLVVLGDRYETLAVTMVAMTHKIPIAHLHGGELTEGAMDDAIRHSITKLSALHFTSTEVYRKRVIQLGENPERVFNVGALGVENIKSMSLLSLEALEASLGCSLSSPLALVTYHPVTLGAEKSKEQMKSLLEAIALNDNVHYIITKANADAEGSGINQELEKFVMNHSNCHLFDSLGSRRYLSLLRYASMVIGNSSSGIIEVPSFGIASINIGDRQLGRIQAHSTINCQLDVDEIDNAIKSAQSKKLLEELETVVNPYDKDLTSANIVKVIKEFIMNDKLTVKKKFYDVN